MISPAALLHLYDIPGMVFILVVTSLQQQLRVTRWLRGYGTCTSIPWFDLRGVVM